MITVKIDRSRKWTASEFQKLEEMNTPCELINGELYLSPAPSPLHQRVLRKVYDMIRAHQEHGEVFFSPIDLYIDESNVLQPDLLYLPEESLHYITERGIEGPPSVVVEVISPSNVFTDRNRKKKIYLDLKVNEYWIIDPANKTIEIYLHDQADPDVPYLHLAGEGSVTSTVFKDLNFEVKSLFD